MHDIKIGVFKKNGCHAVKGFLGLETLDLYPWPHGVLSHLYGELQTNKGWRFAIQYQDLANLVMCHSEERSIIGQASKCKTVESDSEAIASLFAGCQAWTEQRQRFYS